MKNQVHIIKKYFYMSVGLITVLSSTFLIMPAADYIESEWKQRAVLGIVGGFFWISLIGGYTFLFMAQKAYKKLLKKNGAKNKDQIPGGLKFFTNKYAAIADAIFIASVVVLIVLIILERMKGFFPYIVLAVLVFSINMHCLLNGNIYKFILNIKYKEREKCKGM